MVTYSKDANEAFNRMTAPCRCKVASYGGIATIDIRECERHRRESVAETQARLAEHVELVKEAIRVRVPQPGVVTPEERDARGANPLAAAFGRGELTYSQACAALGLPEVTDDAHTYANQAASAQKPITMADVEAAIAELNRGGSDTVGPTRPEAWPIYQATIDQTNRDFERAVLGPPADMPPTTFRGIPAPPQTVAVRRCQNHSADVHAGRFACEWCGYRGTPPVVLRVKDGDAIPRDAGWGDARSFARLLLWAVKSPTIDEARAADMAEWMFAKQPCQPACSAADLAAWVADALVATGKPTKAVNGEDGGCHVPTSPIVFDGAVVLLEEAERRWGKGSIAALAFKDRKPPPYFVYDMRRPPQPAPRPGQAWRDPSGEEGRIYDTAEEYMRIRMTSAVRVTVHERDLRSGWTFVSGPTEREAPREAFERVLALELADRPEGVTERQWLRAVGEEREFFNAWSRWFSEPEHHPHLQLRNRLQRRRAQMAAAERAKR